MSKTKGHNWTLSSPKDSIKKRTVKSLDNLATRIRKSDSAALEEAYRLLSDPLVRYLRRFLSDTASAYDVLQDIFLKLWEDRESLREDTRLKPLMYTMARNRALNVIRKNSKQAEMDDEQLIHAAGIAAQTEGMLDAAQLQTKVDEWLAQLPPRRAEAFMLSRFHELKYSEVAIIMGLSERTVQTHVLHALRDLRKNLQSYQQES